MSQLKGAVILFDLDGTLVDTAPDLVRALAETLAEDGFPPASIEDVRAMVGRGARALLQRGYARVGTARPEPVLDARVARFIALYDADIARHSKPFPGAVEALDALAAAGAELALATNKPQGLTEKLMATLGLSDRFVRMLGADAVPRRKPHPGHLAAAAGGWPALARAVMVGDSETDAAAARAAGVPLVLMAHGYSETPLDALGADRVLASFEGLPAICAELLAREN